MRDTANPTSRPVLTSTNAHEIIRAGGYKPGEISVQEIRTKPGPSPRAAFEIWHVPRRPLLAHASPGTLSEPASGSQGVGPPAPPSHPLGLPRRGAIHPALRVPPFRGVKLPGSRPLPLAPGGKSDLLRYRFVRNSVRNGCVCTGPF